MAADRIASRYETLEKLGSDLVSEEFRAHDHRDNRTVAIKLLNAETCRRSSENLFRFRRVIRELAGLKHPNLPEILDHGEWDRRDFVVTEWDDGRQFLRNQIANLPFEEALRIMQAVCHGIETAHQKGILHGLLNPDSVLIDRTDADRFAILREFGTGLLIDLTNIRDKRDVRRVFGYLAPEQSGILRRPADERSDLYSMGILFYELLAGSPPYLSEEVNVLISEHISRTPASLRERHSKIPETLEKIVFKLIAKDPDDRYQTIAGVLADLEIFASLHKEGRGETLFEIGLNDRLRKPSFATRLVGREAELNHLRETVKGANEGRGSIVFIHGEPGIGKTRLINELRVDVHRSAGLFIGGKCSQYDAGTPFKVLSMAIESYVDRVRRLSPAEQTTHVERIRESIGELGGEIVKLTPKIRELIGEPPPLTRLEPNQEQMRFLVTTVNFLAGIGKPQQSLVIFLDDLQWSDEGSCELLERLAAKFKKRGVTLIICYRDNEVDASHPLVRLQGSLQQNGIEFGDIPVKPFESEQTCEIVSRVLLEPRDRVGALAEYLRGRTQGNPFFILELLRTMVEEGVVRYEGGHCIFDHEKLEKVNLPDNIVEAVLRRIRDLSEADLQVLSLAAVIGKEVKPELLSILTNRQTEDLVSSIDRAVEQQILARDADEDQSVSFIHDRVREAFYSRVKDVGELHRQIAEALESRHRDDPGPVVYDLAYHFARGNVSEKALSYSLKAAALAARSSAHDIAIDLYEKARKILESEGNRADPRYMDLLEQLGESYRVSGHFDEAIKTLRRCEHLVRRHAPDPLRIARVLAKIGDAYFEKGEMEKSAAVLEQALKGLGISLPRSKAGLMFATLGQFARQLYHMVRPKRLFRHFPDATVRDDIVSRMLSRLVYVYYFSDLDRSFYAFLRCLNQCENRAPSRMLASHYALGGPTWVAVPWFWKANQDVSHCLELARLLKDGVQEARAYVYFSFNGLLNTIPRHREALDYSYKAMRMLTRLGEYYDLGVAYVFREMCNCKVTPCDQSIRENNEFFAITRDAGLQQQISWCLQYNAYHHAIKGDFTDEHRQKCLEANRLSRQVKDLPTIPLTLAFLAFGHLRMKRYAEAIECARQVEELIPTHQLKAAWIMDLWPICGQVYLDAITHMPGLSDGRKSEFLDKAYYFCKEGMRRARKYGYIYGWICRNYGTYWRLRGKPGKARRYWERGIRFLRPDAANFELASVLREAAFWMLKDDPADRQAQEYLMEARELFTKHDCLKDAAEVAAMLHGSSPRAVRRTREALTFKRHLESLLSVTQAIGSVFELEDLLDQIVNYAMEVTGAERGCILLNSEKTRHLELRVGRGWSVEVSQKPFSYESYGISLALIEAVRQRAEARNASAKDEGEIGAELGLYGVRQAMGVPLRTKEKDLGILYLDNHLADGVFGSEELELMKSFAVQATVSIENTQLVQSLLEQDRLKQEMRLGREIQQGFLPKQAPKIPGLRVSAVMDPAREIGGDYYDFILRPAVDGVSPLAIVIGDVTGKGLGAGLNMAMVKTTLLTLSEEPIGLKEILAKANRILHGQMSFGTFISLLYLQWNPSTRTLEYSGAGHCEILIFRKAAGRVEIVRSGGAVLGIVPEIEEKLAQTRLEVASGDKIVLFTDGVVEALNSAEEEFGLARLCASLERAGGLPPDQIVDVIRRDVKEFIESSPQYDDITLIAMELE